MHKHLPLRICVLSLALLCILSLLPHSAIGFAAGRRDDPFSSLPNFGTITDTGLTWRNSSTGYQAVIEDEINLLTSQEERQLLDEMIPLTEYGNVAFWSTREYASGKLSQAEARRYALFELQSASILVINMNLRTVTIQSYGKLSDVITVSRANSITSHVGGNLTDGRYYSVSADAFSRMNSLMRAERIAQPMKVLSEICIALMVGLLLVLKCVLTYVTTYKKNLWRDSQTIGSTPLHFSYGSAQKVIRTEFSFYNQKYNGRGSGRR